MARVSRRRVARELVQLLIAQPARQAELLQQVAGYLVYHKQTSQMHLFVNDVADELLAQQKHISADVITVSALTASLRQHVVDVLKKATGAQTVALTESTNPELLGGIIIRTSQLELDASVKRRLTQLAGGTN